MSSRILLKHLASGKQTLQKSQQIPQPGALPTLPTTPRLTRRTITTTATGGVTEEPKKIPLGLAQVGMTITAGLLVGAGISKNMASFLEENELFVPADDDDDD